MKSDKEKTKKELIEELHSLRQRSESTIRNSEKQFRILVSNIPGIVYRCEYNNSRSVLYISETIKSIAGYADSTFIQDKSKTLTDIIHPDDRDIVTKAITESIKHKKPFILEYRILDIDSNIHWVYEKGQGIYNEKNDILWIDGAIFDITDRKSADQKIQHLATHDTLTNLPNRTLFFDRLNHSLSKARRTKWPLSILFIDLDNFKTINETLGHEVGDMVLRGISERLKDSLRESDTVARLSGNEFIILLENTNDNQFTRLVAEKLRYALSRPIKIKPGHDISVTASIGISPYYEGDDADTLLRKASTAMYHAKKLGKDNFQIYGVQDITNDEN
ncbi:MAG: sensor domain-containing diguanylate cyclase [Fibrobacteria bacterium]|nr:sensor domain-containing diguanylate cyclase [Fibrobacteria bacterium]